MSEQFVGTRRLTGGRMLSTFVVATLLSVLVFAICPLLGADMAGHFEFLDVGAVWRGITGETTDDSQLYIVARLPRSLAAVAVGAGLAAAGCVFQAVLRNPLAEPYTLGVSSGASLAAVLAMRFGITGSLLGAADVSVAALAGAGIAVYAVWRLGRVGNSLPTATLILAGITVAMICSAASMLVLYTSDLYQISRIMRWMMGDLAFVSYRDVAQAAALIGIGSLALLSIARDLNALSAGSDAAASVGVESERSTTIAFAASSLIVGASIALAGPIGAIGLIVPHLMRGVVGPDHRVLLPVSMLAGGAGLLLCDTVARTIIFPAELPVGVLTALLGGTFFLYLLLREKTRGSIWSGSS